MSQRSKWKGVGLLALLAFGPGCGDDASDAKAKPGAAAPEPRAATPFSPPGSGFSIDLPPNVQRKEESADLPGGGKVTALTYTYDDPALKTLFVVGYTQYPKEALAAIENATEALDNAADASAAVYDAKVKDKSPLKLGPASGVKFAFDAPAKAGKPARLAQARLYLIGSRLYNLSVVAPADAFPTARADAYFKSFVPTATK